MAPPFRPLYELYLDAFNSHDFAAVASYLQPSVTITHGGETITMPTKDFEDSYMKHWALLGSTKLYIQDGQNGCEELEDGVRVWLVDEKHAVKHLVRYRWEKCGQEWKQVEHVVEKEVPLDDRKELLGGQDTQG